MENDWRMMSDRQGTWELGGTLAVGASEISQEPRSDESGPQSDIQIIPLIRKLDIWQPIEKCHSDANLKNNFLL